MNFPAIVMMSARLKQPLDHCIQMNMWLFACSTFWTSHTKKDGLSSVRLPFDQLPFYMSTGPIFPLSCKIFRFISSIIQTGWCYVSSPWIIMKQRHGRCLILWMSGQPLFQIRRWLPTIFIPDGKQKDTVMKSKVKTGRLNRPAPETCSCAKVLPFTLLWQSGFSGWSTLQAVKWHESSFLDLLRSRISRRCKSYSIQSQPSLWVHQLYCTQHYHIYFIIIWPFFSYWQYFKSGP